MTPDLQQRHHDYVLGPNQDGRLASVAAGQTIKGVELRLDPDAPFALRGRAVRQTYDGALTQTSLRFLKTRWADSQVVYRNQDFIPESLQMANFGQVGNPGPVYPPVIYPANGLITIDVQNTGATPIVGLTFYWRGVKLFPQGAVPAYTYPPKFAGLSFSYPIPVVALGVSELRQNQIFTDKQDADFVIRGMQATAPFSTAGRTLAEVSIILKDFSRKPFSNDFVPLDILAGAGGWPATIPVGQTPTLIPPFGTGPAQPGLLYPEIFVPMNNQIFYDIQRTDGVVGANQAEDLVINLIGAKVFHPSGAAR